jgi:hypothetical protein
MIARCRAAASVAIALAASAAVVPAAHAHGGDEVAAGRNSAYVLSVQASEHRAEDGRRVVDLTAYPVRRSNGAPDAQAVVTLRIDGRRSLRAVRRGDGHEVLIPTDRPLAWRDWQITATVRGTAGALTVAGRPLGRPDTESPPWVIPAGALLLLTATGIVVAVRRRRTG